MDKTIPLGQKYLDRLQNIEDPAAIVVTTHLFCEHALNRLLEERKKTPGKFIKDNSSFVVKLDFCYNMGFISQKVFENLIKLNKLRNDCAHSVDVDYSIIDHNYHLVAEQFNIENETNIKQKLINIAVNTYFALNNEVINIGVKL